MKHNKKTVLKSNNNDGGETQNEFLTNEKG